MEGVDKNVMNMALTEKPEHLNVMNKLRTAPCPFQEETGFCEKFMNTKKSEGAQVK